MRKPLIFLVCLALLGVLAAQNMPYPAREDPLMTKFSGAVDNTIKNHWMELASVFVGSLVAFGLLALVKLIKGFVAIFGSIILLLVVFVIYSALFTFGIIDNSIAPNPAPFIDYMQNYTLPENLTSGEAGPADLRQILIAANMNETELSNLCNQYGGTWHSEANWLGCEGVGYFDCISLQQAADACIAVQASWSCDLTKVYCKR